MILTSTIGRKRRKGRPKTRWSTEVIKNIQDFGITNWEDRTINRLGSQCDYIQRVTEKSTLILTGNRTNPKQLNL